MGTWSPYWLLKSGYWILGLNAGNFIIGKGEVAYIYIKWALIKRMGLGLGPWASSWRQRWGSRGVDLVKNKCIELIWGCSNFDMCLSREEESGMMAMNSMFQA